MNTTVFNTERSDYYKEKKQRLRREEEERLLVADDAVYIKHYGMSAYLTLVPDAVNFSVSWHEAVIKELQRLERQSLANELTGIALATASSQSKKAGRAFKAMIKGMN